MNEPFDLFVLIVLVAVYFVFRISLKLRRSDQRETGSGEKAFAPETKFSTPDTRHAAFRQANDQCQPRRSADASRTTTSLARSRSADEPSFRVHRWPTQTEMPRHSGWPQLCNNAGNGWPVRCALAAGNTWVLQNAQ
ncbi:hypothetical protein [Ensifer aridi]|uniref:hypothetical protein n=1 Tax=Ensifer aridi TaxID=1708715 RepID=UPI000A0F60DF|nr:hypothetical protein [Ensifer aridi]